jgi:2-polyprenyl-6-methoxyphenol hydroxylase-like FAD-dependent oxidoreductase
MGLEVDTRKRRVSGVRVRCQGKGAEEILAADLVIDASGRGSRSPRWLEALGYPRPLETRLSIHLGYTSRLYRPPTGFNSSWKALAIYPKAPVSTKFGVILPVEGGRWLVTLTGTLRDYPSEDEAGFLQFARALDHPEIYQTLRDATPLTTIAKYRFPTYLRRHYERLVALPTGFLVMGDALCSFNPIYGQGMTVCALEAQALGNCLRRQARRDGAALSQAYFQQAARIADNAWRMASGVDFLYPQVEGKRPWGGRFLSGYNRGILELSSRDIKIATTFYEVLHFMKPPAALFHPYILCQVLKSSWPLS